MSYTISNRLQTQNDLLLNNLMEFYNKNNNLKKIMCIINGESNTSLRIVDWFVTNYAKKYYTVYELKNDYSEEDETYRFKVYNDYKLKLKAYSKKRFDPFCRWERITVPYDDEKLMETTIGQLNFFKWALENKIIDYIEEHYSTIEKDMNVRNSTSKRMSKIEDSKDNKTRKKREELSISACKCIKKENVKIVVKFN
jgi:hypothetical protein|tara:strand:- start:1244 stop:1834 length:591 start_codon:yes stop_codon:yes gene_type:complete